MNTEQRPFRALFAGIASGLGGLALTLLLAPAAFGQVPIDTDGDGILDSIECPGGTLVDTDGDGIGDCQDVDDDGDGIHTAYEGTGDTDGDGVPDYRDGDDDGDGESTLDEISPNVSDDDGDGIPEHLDAGEEDGPAADPDNDGLTNAQEDCLGSDPDSSDTDGDGVYDEDEVDLPCTARDTDGDGLPDFNDADDDGDGIPTSVEYDTGSYPRDVENSWNDVDEDGVPNYRDLDSDGDGKSDKSEFFGAGIPDIAGVPVQVTVSIRVNPTTHVTGQSFQVPDGDADGIPNWLDSQDEDGPEGDADGDGIVNWREENRGSNPYNPDSDGDGIEDGDEHGDADDDGVINRLDADDDGDGIPTREEGTSDVDQDGIPNHHDLDSDGDGRPDAMDATPLGPCVGSTFEVPDGDNTELGWCTDRDCDGIADNQESREEYYVNNGTRWFSRDDAGHWQPIWHDDGTVRPALCDGPCALQDKDCDFIPNCNDPDWTDGPCAPRP
jgi:hypothetical protein